MNTHLIIHKLRKGSFGGILETAWRNMLRSSPIGGLMRMIFGPELVEKLVNAPRLVYWPNIKEPRTFNERLLYRKLRETNNTFSVIADKSEVRHFVSSRVDEDVLNEVYHITEDPESIPFSSLPSQFVIKTGNKGCIIIDDIGGTNIQDIIEECREAMDEPYGKNKHEYWYRNTNPKLIVEKKLHGQVSKIPLDYKFFVFHGNVKCIQVDYARFTNHSRRLYLPDWTPLDVRYEYPLGPTTEEPENLNDMIEIAESIGSGFDFVRVDLYDTKYQGIVFGEITLAPESGGGQFIPVEFDFKLGEYWQTFDETR